LSDDEDYVEAACSLDQTDPTGRVSPQRGVSAANDAEDMGKASTEIANPDPIGAGASGATRPPAADRVQTVPSSGA
jgi:hypothetical protein